MSGSIAQETVLPVRVRLGQVIDAYATALCPALRVTHTGKFMPDGTTAEFQAITGSCTDNLKQRGFREGSQLFFKLVNFATLRRPVWHAENGLWCVRREGNEGNFLSVTGPNYL